jgi:hypothetical protein
MRQSSMDLAVRDLSKILHKRTGKSPTDRESQKSCARGLNRQGHEKDFKFFFDKMDSSGPK